MTQRMKTSMIALVTGLLALLGAFLVTLESEPVTDTPSMVDAGVATVDAGTDAGPRDAGPPDSGPRDAGRDAGSVPTAPAAYDLGPLPAELAGIQWPAVPVTTRVVVTSSTSQLRTAIGTAGSQIRVSGTNDAITVWQSDIEMLLEPGASISSVLIGWSAHRVSVIGGTVGRFEIMAPVSYSTGRGVVNPALAVTDVYVSGVEASVFILRGERHAVVRSSTHAPDGSVWVGDTLSYINRDIIIAGNTFRSAGPQATVRMHDVERTVTVGNRLYNGAKHNYRIHGQSDLNFAARNLLAHTGFMIGTEPDDHLVRQWFVDNVIHYDAVNGIFILPPHSCGACRIDTFVMTGNTAYSTAGFSPPTYPGWTVSNPAAQPFRAWPAVFE